MDIHTPLKQYFGYDTYRPLQEDIIRTVLDGDDALVIMPTGGGKSVCFQIPALLFDGLTIIISPLIALMKDQVDGLKANGVSAAYYNSSQEGNEQQAILERVYSGQLKLLYVAPESLALLSQVLSERYVSCIAVDEAHCISSWGHDFRPSYQQLGYLKQTMPNTPIIALTATADKATREDIVNQLSIPRAKWFVSSFDRPNIQLDVRPGVDRMKRIVSFLKANSGESGIIYCLSRKLTEQVASKLAALGFDCAAYHAGLSNEERTAVQEDFVNDRTKIVCATVAFGMGIDKSNVRFVLHYNLPKNIEGYYQEIGRGGRDGLPAKAVLFHSFADVVQLRKFAEGAENETVQLAKLERMQQFAEATSCRRKTLLSYFGEELLHDCGNCDVCLNPPQWIDGTIIAQKALSAVYRAQEQEGLNAIVDVLRGARNAHVLSRGLDQLKTYGMGRDISWLDWQNYMVQLINQGLLEVAFHKNSVLELTPSARKVLFEQQPVRLTVPQRREEVKAKKSKEPRSQSANEGLFEHLRKIRLALAQERGIPPYLIFNDATLKEMEANPPRTRTAMLGISGVGQRKMEEFGDLFLQEINDYLNLLTGKKDTALKSLELFEQGLTVEEIAEERAIKSVTVISHLCKCYLDGKPVDLRQFVSDKDLERIRALRPLLDNTMQLKPYYEALNQQVPYEHIRIALTLLARE